MPGTEPNLLEDHLGCASSLSHFLVNDSLRRSLAYHRLPRPLVELSVLKLDGSSFEIQVTKMALVAEVKEAVEDFFREFATVGELEISWSHVWGHFCLSYNGQKLVNDKAYIQNLGIKDGDQLQFVRHLSIYYNPSKRFKFGGGAYEQLAIDSRELPLWKYLVFFGIENRWPRSVGYFRSSIESTPIMER